MSSDVQAVRKREYAIVLRIDCACPTHLGDGNYFALMYRSLVAWP